VEGGRRRELTLIHRQVDAITGTVRGVVNPTFTYDADGDMQLGPGISRAGPSSRRSSSVLSLR